MDFPRAWQIARSRPFEEHNHRCSYVLSEGALLCDCEVLNNHPENDGEFEVGPEIEPVRVWTPEGEIIEVKDFERAKMLMQQGVDNGFFSTEQDAVAEQESWADQMEQEMAVAPFVGTETAVVEPAEVESYEEGIDPPVDPLDIPDHYDLPMHGSILTCPKCGGDKTTEDGKTKGLRTFYHPHGILHAPCGQRFGWPDVQNLGEHLCRVCEKCEYGWPEEVYVGSA